MLDGGTKIEVPIRKLPTRVNRQRDTVLVRAYGEIPSCRTVLGHAGLNFGYRKRGTVVPLK